ncbi:MAG TPA: glycosyltransferase [Candidatus Saccharimonadales bacterium]|nr:glycosyltransferase [Candidatus Saccharimonadales bacterium]
MKIAHVTIYPERAQKHIKASGVASYTKNLITAMPATDDEVYILCNKTGAAPETYTEDGRTVIRCFDRSPNFARQLYAELKRLNPDVIHIQQELALFGGIATAYLLQWLLFALRKKHVVITLHGVVSLRKINKEFVAENNSSLPPQAVKLAFKRIYKPLTRYARHIIVHEQVFKDTLIEEYGVPADKISVVYHGVEAFTPLPRNEACQQLGLDAKKDLALFMGYLSGYKGIGLLIEGFAKYAKTNPNAFLVIGAGKHPKLYNDEKYLQGYHALQAKAEALIPAGQYKWIGFIDEKEVGQYYSAADVSVYPYTVAMSSSGPMSFAMGYEKPFLGSEVFAPIFPQCPELFFERTPEALAAKLDEFFSNRQRFEKISKTLKQERLWQTVAAQTHDVYKELARES